MSLRVACVQFPCVEDTEKNIDQAYKLVQHIALEEPDIIVLPEACFFHRTSDKTKHPFSASTHPWLTLMTKWAEAHRAVIIAGTLLEAPDSPDNNPPYLTCAVVFPNKQTPILFQKHKLFRGMLYDTHHINEIETYSRGADGYGFFTYKDWRIGVTLGTELRYSTIFDTLRYQHNCDAILVSSAFYTETQQSNWVSLLKTRAFEYQCYIAAANQSSFHATTHPYFLGQSAIIDSSGIPLSLGPKMGEALCLQDFSKDELLKSRIRVDTSLNIQKHKGDLI